MSGSLLKRPKAATCEDWDEDTQSALPGSKTSANVAVKRAQASEANTTSSSNRPVKHSNEGSDSGYSSRATTVATTSSMSSDRKKPSELRLDPIFTERERAPYSYPTKLSEPQRQAKEKDVKYEQRVVQQRPRHRPGDCAICDEIGYHVEIAPPSPKAVRISVPKAQDDLVARPQQRRRPSSNSQPRPTTMYVGAPPVQPTYAPLYAYTTAWEQPPTPGYNYAPVPYQYVPPPTPPTYVAATYYEQWPEYEEPQPPTAHRRMSSYGRESPKLERKSSKSVSSHEKAVFREQRPTIVSTKSSKSIEDSLAMPPPPRPPQTQITSHRPSTSRSQTYYESSTSSRRQSQASEKSTSSRDQPPSPSRPPSSWRGQSAVEYADRPSMPTGKSRSYTQGSDRVESSTTVKRESVPRRTTTSSVPHEEKEAEAEAYQKKRGSMIADHLTAENLKQYTSRSQDKADVISTTSRRSHQSSKESINGRERSTTGNRGSKTNININGISLSIPEGMAENSAHPVKIDFGNILISMGGKDKENLDIRREQKRLERAPSVASKASRQSTTSGSGVSSNEPRKVREIEAPPKRSSKESSRRSSQAEEQESARRSVQGSRQGSRAGSKVRKSVDYTTRPESYYKD